MPIKEQVVGVVEALRRYPVKSMLGEEQEELAVRRRGVAGDRAWAAFEAATGKVASAKRPKLWRELLRCSARTTGDGVQVVLPDGTTHLAGDRNLERALTLLTGRSVRLIDMPPGEAQIDRAYPEKALAQGLDTDVDYSILVLGGGAPPGTFLDYAALHLITTATLDSITALVSGDAIEPVRYRPNVIIRSPAGTAGFVENAWLDSVVRIGQEVTLRVILQTPRCSIPMLAHGTLPARTAALRVLAEHNRVDIPGFGDQPCAGVYVAVLQEGTIRTGDRVVVAPS
jgi:uncharacterized protein YcbX